MIKNREIVQKFEEELIKKRESKFNKKLSDNGCNVQGSTSLGGDSYKRPA